MGIKSKTKSLCLLVSKIFKDTQVYHNIDLDNEQQLSQVVVHEGWIVVRDRYTKIRRSIFVILRENGDLLVFQKKRSSLRFQKTFKLQFCELTPVKEESVSCRVLLKEPNRSKSYEKTFHFKDAREMESWMSAIASVVHQDDQESDSLQTLRSEETKLGVDDFEFLKVLGKGHFGQILLCREKCTSRVYAAKVQDKCEIVTARRALLVRTELRILKALRHPFLILLKCSFQTQSSIFYVMEYAHGGDLGFHVEKCRVFDEDRARFYAAEITLALDYLHERKIFYRDLKLGNVMLDKVGHVKLVDFGLSKENFDAEQTTSTMCGTPSYIAPEVLIKKCKYGICADWWCLGVACYKMLSGKLPFHGRDRTQLYNSISKNKVKFSSKITPEAKDFMSRLLTKDPLARLGGGGAQEVKGHEFFSTVNWLDLYDKKIQPPFVPELSSDIDTRYFDKKFTNMRFFSPTPDGCEHYEKYVDFSYQNNDL